MSAPTRDTWRELIRPALQVVDSLKHNGYGDLDFRLGGGTVLMLRFDHRISKDIDIFTHDAQALGFLSPRLNDVAERLATSYEEQSNAVKLVLQAGDVDFIVAGSVIPDAPTEPMDVEGTVIMLEATCEILAKKLLFRADSFKPRDVFDMAAALALDPAAAQLALRATKATRAALLARLAEMARAPQSDLVGRILMTQNGQRYAVGMVDRLLDAISDLDAADSAKTRSP